MPQVNGLTQEEIDESSLLVLDDSDKRFVEQNS
jgi:hypothetical protein